VKKKSSSVRPTVRRQSRPTRSGFAPSTGTHLDAGSQPRRRDTLKQRRDNAVPAGRHAGKTAFEIAKLDIAEREPLGFTIRIVNEPDTRIDAVDLALRKVGPAVAPVRKPTHACFDAAVSAGVETQAQAKPALFIGCGAIDGPALPFATGMKPSPRP
jgi:hypothetical protein